MREDYTVIVKLKYLYLKCLVTQLTYVLRHKVKLVSQWNLLATKRYLHTTKATNAKVC